MTGLYLGALLRTYKKIVTASSGVWGGVRQHWPKTTSRQRCYEQPRRRNEPLVLVCVEIGYVVPESLAAYAKTLLVEDLGPSVVGGADALSTRIRVVAEESARTPFDWGDVPPFIELAAS